MSSTLRDWRSVAMFPFAVYLLVAGIMMWFLDPVSQQNKFAALLASAFLNVALMIYIILHRDFGRLKVVWFTLWWLFLCILLSLALY
jgi:hypothetical protein